MPGRLVLILFACICWGQNLLAQVPTPTEIFGKVTDAQTKEPIPYANIRLIGSVRTALTDPKGEYRIKTIEHVDSISFSFLGFRTRTVAVRRGKTQELNIELGSEELKLVEITVKAGKHQKRVIDTAANYVYYKVVEHKEQNRSESIDNYKYDSYEKLQLGLYNPRQKLINFWLFKPFRFAFDNTDTTDEGNIFIPGILKETVSKVYYRKSPKTLRKYITAEVMSGIDNPSFGNMARYHFADINPYDNVFIIAQVTFMAPFAPRAIGLYRYYLTDTLRANGRTSYKLHFVGKVKEDVALKGYAWIDSATWAIKAITFHPNEKANFNFLADYTVAQEYTLVDNKYWMLSREDLRTVGSILKKKNETGLYVTKLLNRKNFATGIELPDSLFKGPDELVLLDSARYRSRDYWDSVRFEKLTHQEAEVYHISDTFKLVPAWKTYEWLGRFFTAAYADAGPISIGRVLNFASRNNVEGWRLRFGFETNPRFQHKGTPANNFLRQFYFTGYVAYGLKDRVWQYMALTRFALPRINDKWQSLQAMYRYDLRVPGQNEDETLLTFDNIVTLISGTTLSKIMRVREFNFSYEREWTRGFSTIATINPQTFYDVPGVFNFTHVTSDGVSQHVPQFTVTEFVLDSRYSYNDQYFVGNFYRYFLTSKYPVVMFRYTAGVVGIQKDYFNYHNLLFTLKQRLSSAIGHTNYTLRAGKIIGRAPYTSCYLTQGNLGVLLDKFNYNLLREFEFVSDQYVSLWVEHHFEGFFFNKIPGINKIHLREVIFAKALVGAYSKHNSDVLLTPSELHAPGPVPYIELGFGIENILNLFRVDFLWRATYRNQGGPNWGVKFAFQPGF